MRRRNVLDDLNNKLAVDYKPKGTQEQVISISGDNAPENSFTGATPVATAPSSVQQAETPQPTQPIKTQQVEKTTTPTYNSAFIEKATTKNVFAEKNKDVIAPKSTPAQQGFSIPEPKREEFNTYEKQINFLTPPETEEERLAREKKERSSKNLSALFDGLTALSNIYHTTQYAPPQTLSSGTEKMTQKYDKLRENADKIKKEYQNAILKLRQLDDADYQNAWNRWFALRKQYENGEISKQQMEQEWKKLQIQLGENQKDRDLKTQLQGEKIKAEKEEKAKDRAVQRENKKGENDSEVFASADKIRYVPKNKAKHFPWTQMYQAIANTAKNHKQDGFQTIENGVYKNLTFKPLSGKGEDDKKLTQAEIENAVKNYWGYSKEAIRILDNYLNEPSEKLYEDDNKLYD
jgi:hypothetical protein